MTHEQLLAFLAVANTGTFTAASARLHKSQPAVSKLVRNLEAELDLLLFDRGAYRPVLTDDGRSFHERATAVVEGMESLRSFGMALGGAVESVVRLTVDAVAPLAPIMAVLAELQHEFPAVRMELNIERMSGAVDALREGATNLAIASTLHLDTTLLEARPFCRVRIIPVVRADHALALAGRPSPAEQLRRHAQVVLRDSSRSVESPSLNVLSGGLRWTVTDVAAKREIIAAGMGWGGLPEHVVAEDLSAGRLVELDVREFDVATLEFDLLRRRDRVGGVVTRALWSRLKAAGNPGCVA